MDYLYGVIPYFITQNCVIMENSQLINREKEVEVLKELLDSYESELVSVIGRLGIGKTCLIESVYAERIVFKITGLQNVTARKQLNQFFKILNAKVQTPTYLEKRKSWFTAFHLLTVYLGKSKTAEKRVIFFDEIPWLGKESAEFISAFGYFWNSWALNNNFIVAISGSAGSWLREKILHNTGGLYNRVTKRIFLYPFSLYETEVYFQKRNLIFNRHQIAELYSVMGGIPRHLAEIKNKESVAQNINRICFEPKGLLYNEFEKFYPSSYAFSEDYIKVVRILASKSSGLSEGEIIENLNLPNRDQLTKILKALIDSDFVDDCYPFDRQQGEKTYRLADEYSLFYLKFIEPMKTEGTGTWQNFEQTPSYRTWSGYAFESICLKHTTEIKKALGISGIYSSSSTFYHKGAEGMVGCQVDLLIDRNDKVINLCEIKWANAEFVITKSYAADLRMKIALFKHYSQTKKQVFFTFISTYGVVRNENWGMIDKELTLNDLFAARE
jgi:uncharacterized protein